RRRHTRLVSDWSSDVCSSDLVFTEAERAALALAEEGTRLADDHHGVSDETWAQACKHYDDDQLAALVSLVAMINAANRLGVIVQIGRASCRERVEIEVGAVGA